MFATMEHMTPNDELLSVPQVAYRLGLSTEAVRRRIAKGEIRAMKLGSANCAIRVASTDLSDYLDQHVVAVS